MSKMTEVMTSLQTTVYSNIYSISSMHQMNACQGKRYSFGVLSLVYLKIWFDEIALEAYIHREGFIKEELEKHAKSQE